jgi:hypothetical protein
MKFTLHTSEALEAKGVTTNATKKAGIWEALEKPFTASTIGSAKSPTTTAPVCVCVCVCIHTHTHTRAHTHTQHVHTERERHTHRHTKIGKEANHRRPSSIKQYSRK